MKKALIILAAAVSALFVSAAASAQDWQDRAFYQDASNTLKSREVPKVLILGDSITQLWMQTDPGFFFDNGFFSRGISGQTSAHTLLRFREEFIDTGADAAVILIGANDIARNAGPISLEHIAGNIESVCELALAHKIKPILCSVLPAKSFYWRKDEDVRPDRDIPVLNEMLEKYAKKNRITFVDIYPHMVDNAKGNENGMLPQYTSDGVHPNSAGYGVMESVLLPELQKITGKLRKPQKFDLRLMSYNVHNGIGTDGITHYRRVASVIGDYAPDAVAIQEVDSVTTRSKSMEVLQQLAKHSGYHYTFASSIDFQGGRYGIGILSRQAPLSVKRVPLPGSEEARVLLIAEFEEYYFCCTHLSLREKDRLESLGIILTELEKLNKGKDIFLSGDFNATPDSKLIKNMKEHFEFVSDTKLNTFPSGKPEKTIDYIVRYKTSGQKFVPASSEVPQAFVASDHRPVFCGLNKQ